MIILLEFARQDIQGFRFLNLPLLLSSEKMSKQTSAFQLGNKFLKFLSYTNKKCLLFVHAHSH